MSHVSSHSESREVLAPAVTVCTSITCFTGRAGSGRKIKNGHASKIQRGVIRARHLTQFIYFLLIFICVCAMLAPSVSGQTLSENLLKNPGAEADTAEWTSLVNRIETSSYAHSGANSFYHQGLNGGGDGYLVVEQRVDVSAFAFAIDVGNGEAVVGMWADTSDDFAGIILVFLDGIGMELSTWEDETLSSLSGWKEFKFRVPIPTGTRAISFRFSGATQTRTSGVGNNLNVNFDDLFLQILIDEPPTPTPTVTPTPILTQPTPVPVIPDVFYDFSGLNTEQNNLLVFPPGQVMEYTLADIFFRPLTTRTSDDAYTDGFGISLVVEPGSGATFYGKPFTIGDDYVFLRISAWASSASVSLAIGALDAEMAETIGNAHLNGSIGVNILLDTTRVVGHFGYLEALYRPERNAIVPVFQVANSPEGERVIVQFDNLEVYRIPKNSFPGTANGF